MFHLIQTREKYWSGIPKVGDKTLWTKNGTQKINSNN
jgi:hypothetical protein